MATQTVNFSFDKPDVGADNDIWGGFLNGNWDSVDGLLAGDAPITPDINGGTIDGVTVGATTPGSGTFTSLNTTGALTVAGASNLQAISGTNVTVSASTPTVLLLDTDITDAGATISAEGGNLNFNVDIASVAANERYGFRFQGVDRAFIKEQSISLPAGPTASRTPFPLAGEVRFNNETNRFEGFNGTDWLDLDVQQALPTISSFHDPTGVGSWKIVDDTLECWGVVPNVLQNTNPTVTLPKTFARAPETVTVSGSVAGDTWLASKTTTQIGLDTSNSSTPQDIYWHAIGEWDGIS